MATKSKSKRSAGSENKKDSMQYYHEMARKARAEALAIADTFKDKPQRFRICNGIIMDVEVTKADIKTILGKNLDDEKFNYIKNKIAQDIHGFLTIAKYEGWAEVQPNKHPECIYFVYYSKRNRRKVVLCVRKMRKTCVFKPYAIVSPIILKTKRIKIKKGTPL